MKRQRFFEALTIALLAVLIGAVLAAPVMAQGKGGNNKNKDKNDDGGGDGGTTDPLPLTFMVYWLPEEFAADQFNNQGDAIGSLPTTADDGSVSFEAALFHNGVVYDINSFVNEPDWDIYLVKDISDRNNDGFFYVVGIGFLEGVPRGCRLKFAEGENGGPVLEELLTLAPLPGDTRSGAAAVNSSGNVIVMSKSAEDVLHEIYFYNAETGQQVPGSELWQTSDAYHARLNELDVILHHYNDAATGEIRILMWDPATNWWDSWGDDRTAQAINNLGEFCGGRRAEVKSRGNKTTTISVPYVFDGGDFYEFSDYDRGASDLNDTGDVLLGAIAHIYIKEYDQFFDVWTMLDPENSDEDLNEFSRYSHVSTDRLNDKQFILGRGQYYDSGRNVYVRRSFYLVPVSL